MITYLLLSSIPGYIPSISSTEDPVLFDNSTQLVTPSHVIPQLPRCVYTLLLELL